MIYVSWSTFAIFLRYMRISCGTALEFLFHRNLHQFLSWVTHAMFCSALSLAVTFSLQNRLLVPLGFTKRSQHKEQKKTGIKRKVGEEIPTTTEAKIKMEASIKKLNDHLKRNMSPKPLRYSAWASISAEEEFKKDIKTWQQKAEHGFVEALTRIHYRQETEN